MERFRSDFCWLFRNKTLSLEFQKSGNERKKMHLAFLCATSRWNRYCATSAVYMLIKSGRSREKSNPDNCKITFVHICGSRWVDIIWVCFFLLSFRFQCCDPSHHFNLSRQAIQTVMCCSPLFYCYSFSRIYPLKCHCTPGLWISTLHIFMRMMNKVNTPPSAKCYQTMIGVGCKSRV